MGLDDQSELARSTLRALSKILCQSGKVAVATDSRKLDGSRITNVDLYFDELIRTHLKSSLGSVDVWSEEAAIQSRGSNWLAVVDPLDGTENFADGRHEWGVAVSLWCSDRHLASSLTFPDLQSELVSGDEVLPGNSSILSASSGFSQLSVPHGFRGLRVNGCATYSIYSVIHGRFSAFWAPKVLRAWDIQAPIALADEYGCRTFVNGAPYDARLFDWDAHHSVEVYAPGVAFRALRPSGGISDEM